MNKQEQYIKVYTEAIRALGLTNAVVYCFLLGFGDKCYPSIQTIAQECGIGVRTANRALQSLKECGAISFNEGRGVLNHYTCAKLAQLKKCQNGTTTNAKTAQEKCQNGTTTNAKMAHNSNSYSNNYSNNDIISHSSEVADVGKHYEELKADISNDTQVRELLLIDLKVPPEKLLELLQGYHRSLLIAGENRKTRTDYRKHFHSWSKNQLKREQDEQQRRKPKGTGKHPNADFSDAFKQKLARGLGLTE